MAITVHPVEHGYGFTYVTERADGSIYTNLRQGDEFHPWSRSEATKRAETVGSLTANFVVQSPEAPSFQITAAGKTGNLCKRCGEVIPPTRKRGRPRKTHEVCPRDVQEAPAAEPMAVNIIDPRED